MNIYIPSMRLWLVNKERIPLCNISSIKSLYYIIIYKINLYYLIYIVQSIYTCAGNTKKQKQFRRMKQNWMKNTAA